MKFPLTYLLLMVTVNFLSQNLKLKLASDVWPPFTDAPPKHAFALDLVNEALARNKILSQVTITDFKEVMNGITNKQFDGSAALWYSPERETYLLFSEPYLENRLVLVGKKGSNVSARNLPDLAGKRIAVVESYAYGSLNDARKVRFVNGNSDQQNLERLLKGEVDYLLADALLIEYLMKYQTEEVSEYLEIGTNTLLRLPLHFAIRRDVSDAEKIIHEFNEEIQKMIAEGTYNKILQLNWLASDVDGDGQTELVLSGEHAGTQAPLHGYTVRSQPGSTPDQVTRFVVDGNLYPTWESIPDKYKIAPAPVSEADKKGFGQTLKF